MKKITKALLSALVCTTLTSTPVMAATFTDVPSNAWYKSYVDYVSNAGMLNGTGNGKFSPNGIITRGMMAQILWNREGRPGVHDEGIYDVSGKYYQQAANWAQHWGILTKNNYGQFNGDTPITREQFATSLYRYNSFKYMLDMGPTPAAEALRQRFPDGSAVSSFAALPVLWAASTNIMGSNGRLNPKGTTTRAEAAKMLTVADKIIKERGVPYDASKNSRTFQLKDVQATFTLPDGSELAYEGWSTQAPQYQYLYYIHHCAQFGGQRVGILIAETDPSLLTSNDFKGEPVNIWSIYGNPTYTGYFSVYNPNTKKGKYTISVTVSSPVSSTNMLSFVQQMANSVKFQ